METLKLLGQVAGIGGIAIGTSLVIFREVIRKNIFPQLSKADAYRVIRLISVLVWSITIAGIIAWVATQVVKAPDTQTFGDKSPTFKDMTGNVNVHIN